VDSALAGDSADSEVAPLASTFDLLNLVAPAAHQQGNFIYMYIMCVRGLSAPMKNDERERDANAPPAILFWCAAFIPGDGAIFLLSLSAKTNEIHLMAEDLLGWIHCGNGCWAQLAIVYVLSLSLLVQKMSAAGFFGRTSARSANAVVSLYSRKIFALCKWGSSLACRGENVKVVLAIEWENITNRGEALGLAIFEKLLFIFLACYVLEVPDIL
jgi:hypothetical protein